MHHNQNQHIHNKHHKPKSAHNIHVMYLPGRCRGRYRAIEHPRCEEAPPRPQAIAATCMVSVDGPLLDQLLLPREKQPWTLNWTSLSLRMAEEQDTGGGNRFKQVSAANLPTSPFLFLSSPPLSYFQDPELHKSMLSGVLHKKLLPRPPEKKCSPSRHDAGESRHFMDESNHTQLFFRTIDRGHRSPTKNSQPQ